MVVIRLARFGAKKVPKYRILVADSRRWRNGRYLENLGYYNPNPQGQDQKLVFDLVKAKEWVAKGAQPSDRVQTLIKMAETGAQ